jgi:anti-sigma factor RsiW
MHPDHSTSQHPDTEEIAAYLSGALPASSKSDLEAHLTRCRACRTEVASARRLLRKHGRRRRWSTAVPAGLAATIAAYLIIGSLQHRARQETNPFREGRVLTPDAAPVVRLVAPTESDSVNPERVEFIWHRQGTDPLYRLTLTDPSGAIVWTGETSDTTLSLAKQPRLTPGRSYLWYVDALDSDGRSATSAIHRLQTAP